MKASLMFFVFSAIYLVLALKLVASPIGAGFFLLCFGGCLMKAIHVSVSNGFRFASSRARSHAR